MMNERAVLFSLGSCQDGVIAPRRRPFSRGMLAAVLVVVSGWGVSAIAADMPPNVVEQESGYYYTIQKGDTLWDLSRRFADTPFYWPELWQENKQIPNPHRIFPGERIRLYRKTWTEPLAVAPAPEPSATGKLPAAKKEPPYYRYPGMVQVGFVRREPVTPSGSIFKLPEDKTMTAQYDIIYVRPSGDTPLVHGQQYTVYRTSDPLMDPDTKAFIGYQHLILGIAEIIDATPELAKASIVRSFRPMKVGDTLMPHVSRSVKVPLVPSAPGIQGKILCAEMDQTMFGDNTLVFINRGSNDGIRDGQQYTIFDATQQHTDPQSGVHANLPPLGYGTVLVLRTEADTATALITRSKRDIKPGSLISTPR